MTGSKPHDAHHPAASFEALVQVQHEGVPATADHNLQLLAREVAKTIGGLQATLDDLVSGVGERSPADIANEMLSLERLQPAAFYAGALAGITFGRYAGVGHPAEDPGARNPEPDVVSQPDNTDQTGASGLGYMERMAADEANAPPDDKAR